MRRTPWAWWLVIDTPFGRSQLLVHTRMSESLGYWEQVSTSLDCVCLLQLYYYC